MKHAWWTIEVLPAIGADDPRGRAAAGAIRILGIEAPEVRVGDLYYISVPELPGADVRAAMERAAQAIFSDPVTQVWRLRAPGEPADGGPGEPAGGAPAAGAFGVVSRWAHRATVMKRPGVMDPVEASAVQALGDLGIAGAGVRAACRYHFDGPLSGEERTCIGGKALSNPAIEEVYWDAAAMPAPFDGGQEYRFRRVEVPLDGLGDRELLDLSARLTLSLDLDELKAIRDHFRAAGRPLRASGREATGAEVIRLACALAHRRRRPA